MIFCTCISLIVANSSLGESYNSFWHLKFGVQSIGLKLSLEHWINDGLMAVFFLLVGLEIKRELVEGELSNIKKALLPIVAALGGMFVPALIYGSINLHTPEFKGWGIPMATDIAFAVGIISLVGSRVPVSLKIMLTALAIVDDLGAIVVIALFYSKNIQVVYLGMASGVLGILFMLNKLKIDKMYIYILLGLLLWYFIFQSGVHATIAGVLLALTLPLGEGKLDSVGEKLEDALEIPVGYFIVPFFALCNTGFIMGAPIEVILGTSFGLGIILGLFIGKPLGIFLFSFITIKLGMASLPSKASWGQLLGIGFLGGIGFTMSIFITLLAFDSNQLQTFSKVAILLGSLLSGMMGYILLRLSYK